ncbi:MAG: carboxypeptidase regulatory-like domain-containing protein [Bryobacteraceae bacterium]
MEWKQLNTEAGDRPRIWGRSLLAGLWLLLVASTAFPQTQSINGSIRGRIVDATGSPVAQTSVSAENADTGFVRSTSTSDEGYYDLPNLPIGSYSVTIQKAGFETLRHTAVTLNAGSEAVIDDQLKVGATSTSIEVTGGAPVIEPSRTNIGRTITYAEISNLPLTSRNPYNFIILQPGVSGHPNAELGIPRTVNTNGLLDRINYQMDGMVDTESDRYGVRLFPIADIYVQEIQTVSNSFAPEFGLTSGDLYNVITGSGTNQFHGQVMYVGRPTDASARPILLGTRPKPDLTLNDTSVNAGGAIIKNRLFIFGAYEHLTRGLPSPNTINPTSAAQLGIAPSLLATAPSVQHAQFANLRADWQITAKHQFFVRLNYFRNEYPFNTNVGGIFALDAASDFKDRAYIAGGQLLSTFSPTVLNELRLSDPYRNEKHVANALNGPGPVITVSGVATFNGSNAVGDVFAEKIPSLNDNLTLVKGGHTIKVGGGVQRNLDVQLADTYSQYTFPTIPSYLAAKSGAAPFGYSTYQASIGTVGAGYHSLFWNVFGQDSWQVRPNLLVTYGIRYDRFSAPNPPAGQPFSYSQNFRTPTADFAPRLGIAWTITPKTVIRVNSGIFYEAPATNLWYNALYNNGSNQGFVASIRPGQPFAPAFPQVFNSVSSSFQRIPDITTITPNYKNAYTFNSSFQITQQLTNNDSLMLGYVNTGARNQVYLRNMNLINPIRFLADGRPVFGSARLDPRFGNITLQDIGAIAAYNAMLVNWQHRLSRGVQVSASYTWSHSISDAPDANSFEQNLPIEDPTNRSRDRGNSIINRPHAFTMSAYIAPQFRGGNGFLRRLANNNELAVIANVSSGDAQNILANQVLNGDGITGSVTRPLYVGRYTARGPNIYQFDARYTRTIFTLWDRVKPKFIAEANNIFNHPNITTINVTSQVNADGVITVPPSLAPVSTTLEGRIIQLGVRCDW